MALGQLQNEADLQRWLEDQLDTPNLIPAQAVASAGATAFGLVTALPTVHLSAGDTCVYEADPTNGVYWNLIYDGQGSYPWKVVGGSPLAAYGQGTVTTTSATFATPTAGTGSQITLTLPLAGDYDIWGACEANSAGSAIWSYAVGALAASFDWSAIVTSGSNFTAPAIPYRHTGRSASDSVAEKVESTSGTATFQRRSLRAMPVRVG
jgi:hypothetical protein